MRRRIVLPARRASRCSHRPPRRPARRAMRLPSLWEAQRCNLAPATRDLRCPSASRRPPMSIARARFDRRVDRVRDATGTTSTRTRASSRAQAGRRVGAPCGSERAARRVLLPPARPVTAAAARCAIEEAGAEDSRYDVLVDGVGVHSRGPAPEQRGTYGGQVGLVHYDIDLPKLRRSHVQADLPQRVQARSGRAHRRRLGPGRQGRPAGALRRHGRERPGADRQPRQRPSCAPTCSAGPTSSTTSAARSAAPSPSRQAPVRRPAGSRSPSASPSSS